MNNHVETQTDFRKAIALEDARRRGKRVPPFSQAPQALLYSDHVRYVDQLRRYRAVFPPEQVLVLIYDDFRRDNDAILRRVLRFLEVDDTAPLEAIETKPLQAVRSVPLLQLGLASSIVRRKARDGGRVLKALEAITPRRPSGAWYQAIRHRLVYAEPHPPDERLMVELRRRFKPEVIALSDYLDRDLVALWGYDRLD